MSSAPDYRSERLLTPAMLAVMAAQFLSAFADNALLIGAILLVKSITHSDQLVPWLQASFVLPFILLAALVGPFADNLAKVWGTHTAKFGVFYEWIRNAQPANGNTNGQIILSNWGSNTSGSPRTHAAAWMHRFGSKVTAICSVS